MKSIIQFYKKGSIEIVHGQSSHCFPLHSHESFCVGVITKGTVLFTINGIKCLLKEHMAFIIPPNTGTSITPYSQYNYITICFKNELKRQLKNIKFNKYFLEINQLKSILTFCNDFKRNDNENQLLNSVLKLINSAIEPNCILERKRPNKVILLICEYIKKNAIKKFDLDKLSKSFYLSKYHLIRIFKREMGVTPNQYYIQEKMRIIKEKIFNVNSETNLALALNLSDQSHLCKLFKKQMGISIQDYKKNLVIK